MNGMKPWLVIVLCLGMASCASAGRTGLVDGKLRPCPGSPNCVSSEGAAQGVAALHLPGADGWRRLRESVEQLGGVVESEGDGYLHATFRSKVFGFVDDLECRRDGDAVQVRSAARTGWWDMGVNRRRVERLRKALGETQGD